MGGRQRGGEVSVSVLGQVDYRTGSNGKQVHHSIRTIIEDRRANGCPVCEHPDPPGSLELHLSGYHSIGDMRDSLRIALNTVDLPGPLRYLIAHGDKKAVARIVSVYKETGLLQIPSIPGPRPVTRVLWKASETGSLSS